MRTESKISAFAQVASVVGVAALLASASGCGNSLASVSGSVTLDGKPLAGGDAVRATIYYYPEGGSGAPAVGLLDESGRYEIATGSKTGVQPGGYIVTVSATKIIPPKQPGEAPTGQPLTARKYADPRQSGFRVEVEPGSNTFDFDLESQARVSRR